MSVKQYTPDFYQHTKRFKADSSSDSDDYENRSSASSPSLSESSPQLSVPQMPLNSIANKLNTKPSFDFANAYNGLSQNYYSPQNYENYSNYHLNAYNNQYNSNMQQTTNQYSMYSNYNNCFQNRQNMINTNRSSLGASSSSADTSSVSLSSPSQSHNVDENNSPLQQSIPKQNSYNNLLKEVVTPQQQVLKPEIADETSNSSFNFNDTKNNASKKRRAVPVHNKDNAYWEKRRKNNESAKRSRDLRRCKEEHISIRVVYLEQENLQLRTECTLLRSEVEKLRAMIYTQNQN